MRRSILKTVVAMTASALLLTACGGDSSETGGSPETGSEPTAAGETRTLVMGGQPTADYTPLYVALEEGMFADAGIDLELVSLTGAGTALTALSNNSIDMVNQSPVAVASANQAGADYRYHCGTADTQWGVLLATPDSGIAPADEGWEATVQSWEGLKVGVPTLEGAVQYWVFELAEAAGLGGDALEYIPVGVGESAITALTNGDIDLLYSFPFQTEIVGDRAEVVIDLSSEGPESLTKAMFGGWLATQSWLEDNPDLADAFCEVMGQAIDFVGDPSNLETVKSVMQQQYGLEGEPLQLATGEGGPLSNLSTDLSCERLQLALESAVRYGLLDAEPAQSCDTLLWNP